MTEEVKQEDAAPVVLPIGDIKIQMGKDAIVFNPTDDITPKEVALIFQMFLNSFMQGPNGSLDFGSYIVNKNLGRHFVEMKSELEESQENSQSDKL